MTRRSRLSLVTLIALAAALGAAVPIVGVAAPAQAHDYLVSSTPKAGETLTTLPKAFTITTNDVLLNIDGTGAGFGLQVTDSVGKHYGDGCVAIEGTSMSTAAALGTAGAYTVTWQAVSTDGHTVSDSFGFIWQPTDGVKAAGGCQMKPKLSDTVWPSVETACQVTVYAPAVPRAADRKSVV